jgi:hypothetical protein
MRKRYFLFLLPLFFSGLLPAQTTTISVVFHVVYNTSQQNIPDSCLQHQLDVLNEDFNAVNADIWKVPAAWVPLIGSMNVNFVLATVDPQGNATTGIERRQYPTTSWTTNDNVKFFATGGLDAWPDTSYLNIWVCNLSGGLPGYTQFPGGPAATDGVVLNWQFTGRGSYAQAPFNLGRVGTHEVGHWFGLLHFTAYSNCAFDQDNIPDTPTYSHQGIYGGFTTFQVITDACNPSAPGVMWMNYMTYVNDSSMHFFTQDQVDTMTWVMNNMRFGNSPSSVADAPAQQKIVRIFPSPSSSGLFTLTRSIANAPATITVYNLPGEIVARSFTLAAAEKTFALDLSTLPNGCYIVTVMQNGIQETERVIIAR